MIYVRLLLTISLPLLLGLGVVALIYRKEALSFLERIALAWGIGLGLLGMSMFTLSLFGVRLTLISSALPALIATIGLIGSALARKYPLIGARSALEALKALSGIFTQPNHAKAVAEKLLALLIILTVAFVFFDALVKPIVNFDDLWRQGCIARVIYTTGQVLTEQTRELAHAHPYLNPVSQAWVYLGLDTWNDALGKIIFAFCFTSLLIIFYQNLRRESSRSRALLFTYLLTSFPLIVFHAGTAYSDFLQTFYYSAGVIYLYQWLKRGERPDLCVSALLLSGGIFSKQLGFPLWVIASIGLFAYLLIEHRERLRSGALFPALTLLASAPWLFNKNSFLLRGLPDMISRLAGRLSGAAPAAQASTPAPAYGPPSLFNVLGQLSRKMFFYADWQLLWAVLLLVVIFFWPKIRRTPLKYLLLMIGLNFVMLIYAFMEPTTYPFLMDGTLVQRLMMYQVPLALFLTAMLTQFIVSPSETSRTKDK